VALVARNEAALAEVAATLTGGGEPVVIPADLKEADEAERVVEEAAGLLGGIDILVNNAAVAARLPITETSAACIDEMLAVNVRAMLVMCGAVVPSMKERGWGSIVNLSSVSGLVGTPHRAAYAATKGAIDAATRSLALELGPSNIRVNSVAPGVVDTELWAKNKAVPGVVEAVNALTPLGRWAVPQDIADVIVFLCSDAARFVTAQTIAVDGGMGMTMELYRGAV
jgi:NAD(P)-dependent dehydrogenase (short-subunit alcohol dehydrogenase family)